MDIIKIIIFALITIIFTISLKKKQPEIALVISIAGAVIVSVMTIKYFSVGINYVKEIIERYNVPIDNLNLVLKIIGIAYISELAVNMIKDAGESSIASRVEMAGKVIIVFLTLPMMTSFIELISKLI